MTAFKHVLVPTDFGESAGRALDLAIEIAAQSGAKITLLHAWVMPSAYAAYQPSIPWPEDDLRREARMALDGALAKATARYPNVESALVHGEPWREILERATEGDVDLIVMGTHGRRGLSHVFLGSAAEKVVRMSPVPVMTVSAESEKKAKASTRAHLATATKP